MNCRRCSDCVGQDHHWIDNGYFFEGGDPEYQCKHCDAFCHAIDDVDGFSEPSGVLVRWVPREADDECVRDDSTECDCRRCGAAEDTFWETQGEAT